MTKAIVSCIITTYNRPVDVLLRAARSILCQTYGRENLDIIVVNDCPDNKSLAEEIGTALQKEDKSITYLLHEHNKGACAARNTGINASKGEYLAFLDDDDEWMPDKIENMLELFTDINIALVYGPYFNRIGQGKEPEYMARKWYGKHPIKEILKSNFIGSTSLPLLKRECVMEVGKFDESIVSSQDHDLWIRLLQKYDVGFCNKPSIIYNVSEVSITKSKGKRAAGYQQLIKKYKDLYKAFPGLLHERLLIVSAEMARDHSWRSAFVFFVKAWIRAPFSKDNYKIILKMVR